MNHFDVSNIGKAVFVAIAKHRHEIGAKGSPVDDVDVARGYWKFKPNDLNNAQQSEVLVAVFKSKVVGAWKIKSTAWQKGFPGAIPTRVPAADDKNRYWCDTKGVFNKLSSDTLPSHV